MTTETPRTASSKNEFIFCFRIARRASDVMTQTNKLEWWMILKISLCASLFRKCLYLISALIGPSVH